MATRERTSDTDDGESLRGIVTYKPEQLREDPAKLAELLKAKDGTPGKDVALRVQAENERAETAAPLVAEGVKYAKEWGRIHGKAGQVTKKLAEVLVQLRALYPDPRDETKPDMSGLSYEYKNAAGAIYDRAGFDRGRKQNAQAAVRHHLSIFLRAYMRDELNMTAADFEFYDLNPLDRNALRRGNALPALRLDRSKPGAVYLGTVDYARRALEVPDDTHSPAEIPAEERDQFRETLEAIRARADELLEELDAVD